MGKIFVNRISDQNELKTDAAKKLSSLFTANKQYPVLFLSSGGSVFDFYDLVAIPSGAKNITFSVLDERISREWKIRNFARFQKTKLYKQLIENDATILTHGVKPNEDLDSYAGRFGHQLKNWLTSYPNGKIIITQGIGTDGHTAGIVPFTDNPAEFKRLFLDPNEYIVGYDAHGRNPFRYRVTVTMSFMKMVDYAVFYMAGPEKRRAYELVFAKSGQINEVPGRIVRYMKNVYYYTDYNK